MKKTLSVVLCTFLLVTMAACGDKQPETGTEEAGASSSEQEMTEMTQSGSPETDQTAEWTLTGFFQNESEYMLSITWMDYVDEPGWYVGCMLGGDIMEDSWGGTLKQEGNTLRGSLPSSGGKDDLTVTVSREGADGVLLVVEGGETYHFAPMDIPKATIFVNVRVDGWGMISYEKGETVPEIDPEWPFQSAQVNLAEPETYSFAAAPEEGYVFVKWTKNGEDYSAEPVISVLLEESADFVAVFEENPGWQNPVMNFIGEYQCERAHAVVACSGKSDAWITIEWGDSVSSLAHWDVFGRLDTETLTIKYSGCTKSMITYNDQGEIVSQEPVYQDGTGTIIFHDDGTFTWHEDQSVYGDHDMKFEWAPAD